MKTPDYRIERDGQTIVLVSERATQRGTGSKPKQGARLAFRNAHDRLQFVRAAEAKGFLFEGKEIFGEHGTMPTVLDSLDNHICRGPRFQRITLSFFAGAVRDPQTAHFGKPGCRIAALLGLDPLRPCEKHGFLEKHPCLARGRLFCLTSPRCKF